jgi:N-acetyl-anhydromuramyl-L-alanine amidase AmpD
MGRSSTFLKALRDGGPSAARAAIGGKPAMEREELSHWSERVASAQQWSQFMHGTADFNPRLIIEHWTECTTQQAAVDYWNQSADATWVHFIIDPAGKITQLAPLDALAKHAFGVSPWAIGVEHVGLNDEEVMGNRPQMDASVRLTAWLQKRLDIPLDGVIGHGEVTSSPYFGLSQEGQEWVEETGYVFHHDFSPTTMEAYREMVRKR